MRLKVAGAAMAAVVFLGGTTAGVVGAEASTLTYDIRVHAQNSDGNYYDIDYANGSYAFHAQLQEYYGPSQFNVRYVDGSATVPFNYSAEFNQSSIYDLNVNGFKSDVQFSYTLFDDYGGKQIDQGSYTADTTIVAGFLFLNGSVVSSSYSDSNVRYADSYNISFNYTLSSVPLPASAPMFGAALLALGGAGYARRRLMQA